MYHCEQGYKHIPGTNNFVTCRNFQWLQPGQFCRVSCCSPPQVAGAVLQRVFRYTVYSPVGSIVRYDCIPGFARVPNTENSVRCGADVKWSQPENFCKESCTLPPLVIGSILQAKFQGLQYFPLGTVVKYDCRQGYVHVPGTNNYVRCGPTYQWTFPQEFCKGICPPPPLNVMDAKLKKEYVGLKKYYVDMEIKYECKEGYRHIPGIPDSSKCASNLKWTRPGRFCQKSCLLPPNVRGATLQGKYAGLLIFRVGKIVAYDCIGRYKRVPHTNNFIICGNNLRWSTPEVFCKESCPLPSSVRNAKLKNKFQGLEYFPVGNVVIYDCNDGYKQLPGTKNFIRCGFNYQWSQLNEFCAVSCDFPPHMRGIKLKREFEGIGYFPAGMIVKYECDRGFQPIPGLKNFTRCGVNFTWSQLDVFCKVMECDDPVLQHGVKVTGFRNKHIYGDSIAFQCNIGYFMISNYLIECGENNMWNPKVPSCEKINAELCGRPLVPSGSVHPSEPKYEHGTYVVIECNPQYSFPDETMEMTTTCQGHNLWKPSVQPCMFRTSPDTTTLIIRNGRVVHGKKKIYKPGDNVTVMCYAGYILQGPSVVRYIGGKKWSPGIPYCSLSFVFILLIAAIIFFMLLVIAKRIRRTYSEERGSTP